ncbi:MAG TPA: uracil-DNA glycosylase family protein [Candidatus Polarisedimenticolia bacterium]|nr:uracil-DNA glycosylase family protein [Candidatus Polarisedimenticolia bacterium]
MPRPILIFGLNPGPYGMAQTGIPFTDIKRLRQKLPDLAARIRRRYGECEIPGLAPSSLRPFLTRSFESSSVRFYRFLDLGWECAEEGWKHVAVANACPLLFVEPASRSNRTPADLRRAASRGIRNDLRARELCQACTRLRCLAAHEAEQALDPRGVILLGKDVQRALAESFEGKLGRNAVVHWEHPARAVPERWARGLLEELRGRAWK